MNPDATTATVAAAIDDAVEQLAVLLDGINHAVRVSLLAIDRDTEAADPAARAQRLYALSEYPDVRVRSAAQVADWRERLVGTATNELVQQEWVSEVVGPRRWVRAPNLRRHREPLLDAEQIAAAGRAAAHVADVVEAQLGVVRRSWELDVEEGEQFYGLWFRDLLLVTDGWTAVLHIMWSD